VPIRGECNLDYSFLSFFFGKGSLLTNGTKWHIVARMPRTGQRKPINDVIRRSGQNRRGTNIHFTETEWAVLQEIKLRAAWPSVAYTIRQLVQQEGARMLQAEKPRGNK
jgi:hypothetical protein